MSKSVVVTGGVKTDASKQPTAPKGPAVGPRAAMAAFRQMDAKTAKPAPSNPNPNRMTTYGTPSSSSQTSSHATGVAASGATSRNPATIKQMLLQWCQHQVKDYPIKIENFSSSWADGLAFCALIHHFYPESFDFAKLNPKERANNLQLAFDTAEKLGGVAPLLEVGDMLKMGNSPDWKCIFTYVQMFYRRFGKQTQQAQAQAQGTGDKQEEGSTTNRHSVAVMEGVSLLGANSSASEDHDNPFRPTNPSPLQGASSTSTTTTTTTSSDSKDK